VLRAFQGVGALFADGSDWVCNACAACGRETFRLTCLIRHIGCGVLAEQALPGEKRLYARPIRDFFWLKSGFYTIRRVFMKK
jgi:hypothetical protein